MNSAEENASDGLNPSGGDYLTALFANLVIQQTNMALMFLGEVKNPENGQTMLDLDGARFFIDQLQMLQAKTKGNLNSDEAQLLEQSLMRLQMIFVQKSNAGADPSTPNPSPPNSAPPARPAEEEKKKFTKKYES